MSIPPSNRPNAAAKSGPPHRIDTDGELVAGSRVGDYLIETKLGRGGMGTVYRAVHPRIGSRVAVKLLHRYLELHPDTLARFEQEARSVNQIRHPSIINIFSFGELPDGRHYHIMEYLEGVSLAAYLTQKGPLSTNEILSIVTPVARALDAAHKKGFVHRDLKPDNVFLIKAPEGATNYGTFSEVKLLDFGIAKLCTPQPDNPARVMTAAGITMGTPDYMSPEQCRGKGVDARSDVYALGVMTFQMLTGSLPFAAETVGELMTKQQLETPPAPSSRAPFVPAALDGPIVRALDKDPARRFQRASDFAQAFATVAPQKSSVVVVEMRGTPTPHPVAAASPSSSAVPKASPAKVGSGKIGGGQLASGKLPGPPLELRTEPLEAHTLVDASTHTQAITTITYVKPPARLGLIAAVGAATTIAALAVRTLLLPSSPDGRPGVAVESVPWQDGAVAGSAHAASATARPTLWRVQVGDRPPGTEARTADGQSVVEVDGAFEVRSTRDRQELIVTAPGYEPQRVVLDRAKATGSTQELSILLERATGAPSATVTSVGRRRGRGAMGGPGQTESAHDGAGGERPSDAHGSPAPSTIGAPLAGAATHGANPTGGLGPGSPTPSAAEPVAPTAGAAAAPSPRLAPPDRPKGDHGKVSRDVYVPLGD